MPLRPLTLLLRTQAPHLKKKKKREKERQVQERAKALTGLGEPDRQQSITLRLLNSTNDTAIDLTSSTPSSSRLSPAAENATHIIIWEVESCPKLFTRLQAILAPGTIVVGFAFSDCGIAQIKYCAVMDNLVSHGRLQVVRYAAQ